MRISDWSSDVCSSDLLDAAGFVGGRAEGGKNLGAAALNGHRQARAKRYTSKGCGRCPCPDMRAYVWNPPNPAYALPQTHDIARSDAGQRVRVGKTVEYALHRHPASLSLIEAPQPVGVPITPGLADRHPRHSRSRRAPLQAANPTDCHALIQ